jgi:WhiB family transcriptional regulator, redox-sensing transcriptional regulator
MIIKNLSGVWGWRDRAACAGQATALFFPEVESGAPARHVLKSQQAHIEQVKTTICGRCPVRSECLEEGLRVSEGFGIWGGFTAEERDKMKRRAVA